jgi:hypothetical protein
VIRKSDSILTEAIPLQTRSFQSREKSHRDYPTGGKPATQLTHQAYQDGLAAANAEISDLLKTARAIAEEVDTCERIPWQKVK